MMIERLGFGREDQFGDRQQGILREMDPTDIPTGTSIGQGIISRLARSGSLVWSVGTGVGGKAIQLAARLGDDVGVLGIDINARAIAVARASNTQANARFEVVDVLDRELVSALFEGEVEPLVVTAEGLFCNLISWDAAEALFNINMSMPRLAHLVVADCLHPYHQGSQGILVNEFGGNPRLYEEWMDQWRRIYMNNMKIFGERERYTFLVTKKGMKGADALTYDELHKIWWNNQFERIARHWDLRQFNALCQLNGFVCTRLRYEIWRSRTGKPLLGFVGEYQKRFDAEQSGGFTEAQLRYLALINGFAAAQEPA